MSNLTQENIWWPDITAKKTEIISEGVEYCSSVGHDYVMTQTRERVYLSCKDCPRVLARNKYLNRP